MSTPLFRPEVLEAKRRSWLGTISLAQPPSLWVLSVFAFLAAVAAILFLLMGEYTRRSRVVGQLVPDLGLATVVSPVSGVVTQQVPEEGVGVDLAQALVTISVPRATAADGDTGAGLRAGLQRQRTGIEQGFRAQDALRQAQATGYSEQLRVAREESAQINAAIATRRQQVLIAEETQERYRTLAAQHLVSDVQLNQQEQARLEQVAALQALQRQAMVAQRNRMQIEQALRELPSQKTGEEAIRMRELAQLEQERLQIEASGEVLVKAPVKGLIANRLIERGQSVKAGQPLLTLLPEGSRLQAQLLVPSRAAGFVAAGDSVVLRYQAFPHQKFGHYRGRVIRISRSALSPAATGALAGSSGDGEPYYRVVVELSEQSITAYGKAEPLRPGMLLEADILGERRKLYEWVLEPIYSLTGKL